MKPTAPVVLTVLVFVVVSLAGPMKEPCKGSEEFERMKTLAGTWQGEMDMGRGLNP